MIQRPRPLRLHWDAERGWLLDAQCTLAPAELQRIIEWALPRQIERLKSLPAGDKRTELEKAIVDLRAGKVVVVADPRHEMKMFEAPIPKEDRKIILIGGD